MGEVEIINHIFHITPNTRTRTYTQAHISIERERMWLGTCLVFVEEGEELESHVVLQKGVHQAHPLTHNRRGGTHIYIQG